MKTKRRRIMKKALAMLMGAVAAMAFSVFSAAAADVEIDTKTAVETSDGVSFTVKSNKLAASQLKDDSTITVTCDGAEGDESPAKLVLDYWDAASSENLSIGEPASVEVAASEYSDGKAVFTYADIKAALGDTDLSLVYAMDVSAASGSAFTCTGVQAANVYSEAEMAENGINRTIWVHPKTPSTSENWGQSLTVSVDQFDTSTFTPNSYVVALYETDAVDELPASPVEFILQSTDDDVSPKAKKGTVWAKVAPEMFTNTFAYFNYDTIVDAYGIDDFSCVSVVYVGDTGKHAVTCTDLFVFNCKTLAPAVPEEPEESSKEETTTTAAPAAAPEETTTTAASSSSDSSSSSLGSNVIFIVIGVVSGIVIAIVALYVFLGKKSKETYDVNSHKFVNKK